MVDINHQDYQVQNITIRYWFVPLLIGLGFIVLGIALIVNPRSFYHSLSLLLGLGFLLIGILKIGLVFAYRSYSSNTKWMSLLLWGIGYIVLAIILFNNPGISILIISFIIGGIGMFYSIHTLLLFHSKLLIIIGILGLGISLWALLNPQGLGIVIGIWLGIISIGLGILLILFSFLLKRFRLQANFFSPFSTTK